MAELRFIPVNKIGHSLEQKRPSSRACESCRHELVTIGQESVTVFARIQSQASEMFQISPSHDDDKASNGSQRNCQVQFTITRTHTHTYTEIMYKAPLLEIAR